MGKRLLVATIVAIGPLLAFAQNVISGHIKDVRTGEPLIGASVIVKSEKGQGVVTDVDGNFKLQTKKEAPLTLRVEYIGYRPLDVEVYDFEEPVEIAISDNSNKLNEVVVLGYQTLKRGNITGAVSSVDGDVLESVTSATLGNKLQGAAPGLLISGSSGVPGTAPTIRLRGATSISATNTPIYIVDGVLINTDVLQAVDLGGQGADPLADLNPEDISSIQVLKDASSTAIYGAKGANGVILINTKRGAKNHKTKVSLKSEWGWSTAPKKWEQVSGPEHAELVNQCWVNSGNAYETRPFRPSNEVIPGYPAYGNPEDQQTYDRLSDVFRTAFQHSYNLSVSGGNDRTNFYIGGEYTSQDATQKLSDFKRFGLRLNLDHQINMLITIGSSNQISFTDRKLIRTGDGPAGLFQAALHTPTFYPIYKEDGSYNKPVTFDNHQAMLEHWDGGADGSKLLNSVYVKLNLLDGLTFKSTLSNDRNTYHEKFYYDTYTKTGSGTNGSATDAQTTKNILSTEQLFNYLKTFKELHNISAFAGTSYQKTTRERATITGTQFPSNQLRRISAAADQTAATTGTSSALWSFFGGVNYAYNDRYSIDFNIRADGSSRFGSDNRWGVFPAIGGSWTISNEKFFKPNNYVGDLKLTVSYGLSGNDNIGDFASLSLWSGGQNYNGGAGVGPSQLGNPSLKWESTKQFNIGVTTSLIKNYVDVEFNYYYKYTNDLLLNETVPGKTGYGSMSSNNGEVSNKGYELIVKAHTTPNRPLRLTSTFTISHNTNKVEKLPVEMTGEYQMFKLFEGKPLYSMWVYDYLGVDPQTGDAIYRDVTGDGLITADDKLVVGDAWPDFDGSWRNVITYKRFTLDFNFYFKSGNKIFNYTRSFLETGGKNGVKRAMQASSLNYWEKAGDTNVLPRPKSTQNADGSTNYEQQNSRFVEDGSFIRLRSVTFGYNLPTSVAKAVGITSANVYITGNNLWLKTKYTGPDPEVTLNGESPNGLVQGLDFCTIPQPRSLIFGLNVTF